MFGKKTIAKIIIEGTIEDEGEKYSQKWLLGTIKKLEVRQFGAYNLTR